MRVLHLLEQVRHYCEACWSWQENHERGIDQDDNPSESRVRCVSMMEDIRDVLLHLSPRYHLSLVPSPVEHQICPAICVLMKLSFDEEHRHAMNELGESAGSKSLS